MSVRIGIIIISLLINCQLFSQTFSGLVTNENGNVLSFVNISIKESRNTNSIISFSRTDRNGKYNLEIKNNLSLKIMDTIFVEASLNGHSSVLKKITRNKKKNYLVNFILHKENTQQLEEVIIIGELPKFKVKQDTISFKIKKYTDGSERKIEDVIKNLPGIDVNGNTGEILYKGKSIETVTLDGDNLFGFNYMLGTKNINVDMVDQIEAISNYSENPLLKNIEQGGKVSLNLKLKKNKISYSGNLTSGLGIFDNGKLASDLSANFLSVSKQFKSFSTLTQNNIGRNYSPFDYFGFSIGVEQQKEQNHFAKKVIPESIFFNPRANINHQFFSNYNAILKFNSKLILKMNLYYLQDRITTNQFYENQYIINNENLTTSDNTSITKKPRQYRGDLEIKYNTSQSSLLEYNLRVRQENIKTPSKTIQNQTNSFSSFLETEDFYIKQNLLWTKKISNRKALQLSFHYSNNNLLQKSTISPSLFNNTSYFDIQESQFKKTSLEGKITYLGSSGKRDKYTFTIGGDFKNSPFESRLFNSGGTISRNRFGYVQKNIFNIGVYNFNHSDWQISPSYSICILNQTLHQKIESQEQIQNDIIFEPALQIKYNFNSVSFLTTNLGYNQSTNSEQYFFLNQILINNRKIIKNQPSLDLQKSQYYSLQYFNNDLNNQLEFNANFSFQKSSGNFFTDSNITESITQIEYFYLPQKSSNWYMKLLVSKYIPYIESTVKLTSDFSISNFRNVINNSELRKNQSQFLNNTFFYKTAFDIPINFENIFTWQYANSKSKNKQSFINNSWQNNFKIIIKPSKKWFFILSSDFYLPDTNIENEYYLFLDLNLKHIPKNKKWQASFMMQNLTNEDNFEQVLTSDISTTIFRSNLLSRYIILNITWNF
jgi:hypothetical protein